MTHFHLWKLLITSEELHMLKVLNLDSTSGLLICLFVMSARLSIYKTSPLHSRTLHGLLWWTNQLLYPISLWWAGCLVSSSRSAYLMHAIHCELSSREVHCLCIQFFLNFWLVFVWLLKSIGTDKGDRKDSWWSYQDSMMALLSCKYNNTVLWEYCGGEGTEDDSELLLQG